ncbi:hypothetical protein ACFV3R_30025 [Streptomyces sp. NPDC059740]|uniref:hypothetical protein n=1 Tax=Streptomyces sp. NPDC059740 TaxID=3346926 RepID=UPI00365437BE
MTAASLAFYNALAQAVVLFSFHSLCPRLLDATRCLRVTPGSDEFVPGGFLATGAPDPAGYLPQAVFVAASSVLFYLVLRSVPGGRPGVRALVMLWGTVLLASGLAELVARALDVDPSPSEVGWPRRYLQYALNRALPAPVGYALWCGWEVSVGLWVCLWSARRWKPFRVLLPQTEERGAEAAGLARSGRRNVTAAGLLPVLLLSIAGGLVMRHTLVRTLGRQVTFAPELWQPYQPPDLVEVWKGVLHPALRLRPLPTEETGGWLLTLASCLLFLLLLAVLLHRVAARAQDASHLPVLLECWSATAVAAALAAAAKGIGLAWVAGQDYQAARDTLGEQLAGAVRFGTVWGWAVGLAVLWALRAARRGVVREEFAEPEGESAHAGQAT